MAERLGDVALAYVDATDFGKHLARYYWLMSDSLSDPADFRALAGCPTPL